MARKPAPVRTLHPLAMAASLEAQNTAVGLLVSSLEMLLTFPDALAGVPDQLVETLREQVAGVRAAMWPDDESQEPRRMT
jgi:hypothetical protein